MFVSRRSILLSFFSFIAVIICTLAIFALLPYQNQENHKKTVYVKNGDGLNVIAFKLKNQDVIRSRLFFKWYSIFIGNWKNYKRGEYVFEGAYSVIDIVRILEEGKTKLISVTFPEGYRMTEIFNVLETREFENSGDYLDYVSDSVFIKKVGLPQYVKTLEGFLFPETYKFSKDTTEKMILETMVNTFYKKIPKNYTQQAEKANLSFYNAVILASIIEKETSISKERRVIASVFHNRLKKGMKLQTDPTVIYGIKNFNGNLTRRQLRTRTPYNTYVNKGLPPTPIANPGLASLLAAVNPESTDYLYFVAKGDGTHEFSTNYRDHRRAVAKYQKRRRKQYRSF